MLLFAGLIVIVKYWLFTQTQFVLWPEMVMYPWLVNHGFLLYRDLVNPYFPLLTYFLAGLTKIFGYSVSFFKFFTWSYLFVVDFLFLGLTYQHYKDKKNTLIIFAVFTLLEIIFESNGLWFDLVCLIPVLLVFQFLFKKKYFAVGLLLGTGLLIKQTTIWLFIFCLIFQFFENRMKSKKLLIWNTGKMIFPAVTLFTLLIIFFWRLGVLPEFKNWAIFKAFGGMQKSVGYVILPTKRNILIMLISFWPILLLNFFNLKNRFWQLAIGFFGANLMLIFPRFAYFHLVLSLPFGAWIVGKTLLTNKKYLWIYFCGLISLAIFFIHQTWGLETRFFDRKTYLLAKKIKIKAEGKKYYLHNMLQQIYLINQDLPTKPWAANYSWYFQDERLQNSIVDSLEKEQVAIVFNEKTYSYHPANLEKNIESKYPMVEEFEKYYLIRTKK